MTDFTLDQYYGIAEEELGQILQTEARKMFNSDSLEIDSEEVVDNFYLTSQQTQKTTLILPYGEKLRSLSVYLFKYFKNIFKLSLC